MSPLSCTRDIRCALGSGHSFSGGQGGAVGQLWLTLCSACFLSVSVPRRLQNDQEITPWLSGVGVEGSVTLGQHDQADAHARDY